MMEKGHEIVNDAKLDTKGIESNVAADFGGDLAQDDGVDLNSSTNADSVGKSLEKTGIGRRFGALAQLPIAALGGKQYDDGRFNPNAQIEAGELDNALRGPGYAEYTDATTPPEINMPDGYTSNIGELMENENAANATAEAERDAYWQERIDAFNQYEAEQPHIVEDVIDEPDISNEPLETEPADNGDDMDYTDSLDDDV